jgi:hypothetical protein
MSEPEPSPPTKDQLLARIDEGWRSLRAAVGRLSPAQLEGPRSADGWTVKDHLAHLAAWEASAVALLRGESRPEAMGVDEATFQAGFDAVNAAVQARSHDQSLEQVLGRLDEVHRQLLVSLDALDDEDLLRSYSSYQPDASGEHVPTPVVAWVIGNTFEHYAEHEPWIQGILAGSTPGAILFLGDP